jgi:hypothetical protein
MKSYLIGIFLAGSLSLAGSASAFPTWMGVYGTEVRHTDGANPGTYTILMNQDYVGLKANVGIQVNGGSWVEFPMTYAGKKDNNSKWTFNPAAAYSSGATVKYYFRGYDGGGNNIWDSKNGQNYSFTAMRLITNVTWGAVYDIPHGAGVAGVDIAAFSGSVYAVWSEGTVNYGYPSESYTLKFSRKAAGGHWSSPVILSTNGSYPKIAVAASGVHVVYGEGRQIARYKRSANDGAGWSAPIDIVYNTYNDLFSHARLRADADYLYIIYNDYRVPETSTFYFRRIHRNATSWEAARFIYTATSYKTTGYVSDFAVRGNTIAFSSEISGWYGFSANHYHESLDGGLTWREDTPTESAASGDAQMTMRDDGSVTLAYSGTSSSGFGLYISTRTPANGYWGTAPAPTFYGDRAVSALQSLGQRDVLVTSSNGADYTVSRQCAILQGDSVVTGLKNAGATSYWTVQDVNDGNRISLLLNDGGTKLGFPQYAVLTTIPEGQASTSLNWLGNTYQWPSTPTNSQPLWINSETWPAGSAVAAQLVYAVVDGDPGTWVWKTVSMTISKKSGNNDSWHVTLGNLPAGTRIQYAISATDASGKIIWDKNGGKDYTVTVK